MSKKLNSTLKTGWHYLYDGDGDHAIYNGELHVATTAGEPEFTREEDEQVAGFLCRACNSHEALLDALKYVVMMREVRCLHRHPGPDIACSKCRADAAIAKAEGGGR